MGDKNKPSVCKTSKQARYLTLLWEINQAEPTAVIKKKWLFIDILFKKNFTFVLWCLSVCALKMAN